MYTDADLDLTNHKAREAKRTALSGLVERFRKLANGNLTYLKLYGLQKGIEGLCQNRDVRTMLDGLLDFVADEGCERTESA